MPSALQSSLTIPTIVFAVSFQVYLLTLCPTIAGGDAGELVAEGCNLGTAHPPGYPLYTVIVYLLTSFGKLFNAALSREAPPVYFVNLLSAALGSGASAIVAYLVERLLTINAESKVAPYSFSSSSSSSSSKKSAKKNKSKQDTTTSTTVNVNTSHASAAFIAGMLHTLSPLAWQYHTTAEVFALNNFLSALMLLAAFNYVVTKQSSFNLYVGRASEAMRTKTRSEATILFECEQQTILCRYRSCS